ncbi:MAG: hypothetical protein ABFR33_03210 [Verrucomicrobiota bacterium]
MRMHWIDWLILLVPTTVIIFIGLRTRRHVKGVSDFMAGGRVAGRYVVAVSDGVAAMGLITIIGFFELYYHAGFSIGFWNALQTPVWMIIALTGFVAYRYRETRAMTMAQYFELRYSKRFRIFCGVLSAFAGVVNYGIFPAVGGRFFVYYCGFPETMAMGGFAVPTFAVVMAVLLSIALILVLVGGQLTNMVSDCLQGIFSYAMYLIIAGALLVAFKWEQISTALLDRPTGESMLNPFDTANVSDFNIWFVMIGIFSAVYTFMAWQGNQGYNCAAKSPHEAKMGRILGTWRSGALYVMITLLAVAAYTFMHNPDFSAGAAEVNASLATIENPAIMTQMTVPVALSHILPIGVTGIFAAMMMFLLISTDTTYLHSWGSIVVQDVILPFRKKPFGPKGQLLVLRLSIFGVAVFVFFFSMFFKQTDYILMFMGLTGAIFLGGAGSAIIGGLYWKKGTTAGAWTAMISGAVLGVGGMLLQSNWQPVATWLAGLFPDSAYLAAHMESFPINGQWIFFIASASAILLYVVVSLATCRKDYNMDRMLHRGIYAKNHNPDEPEAEKPPRTLAAYIGIDKEFTKGDRILSYSVFGYTMLLLGIWLVVVLINAVPAWRWSGKGWSRYWWIMGILQPLVVAVITSVWFTIGGSRDLRRLFRDLEALPRSELDDGRVVGHVNADDVAFDQAAETTETPPEA